VSSQPLQGSCFTLVLPLEPVPEPKQLNIVPSDSGSIYVTKSTSPLPLLTLLLVEDDPMNAKVFNEFLLGKPYEIIRAEDGIGAIECLRTHRIDMVFMDIEMPRLDGLAATQKIRKGEAGEKNQDIPIIAMTAHVLAEFKLKAREAGMNDFIPKPVDVVRLYEIIERYRSTIPDSNIKTLMDPGMLDREEALAALGGNELLLARIYEIFTKETPGLMKKLEQALDTKDIQSVYLLAHTLKGAGARIYAPLCTQAAKELEALASKEDWDQIIDRAQDVLSLFGNLIEHLTPRV
jgi:CheY-like chemotaxis protein